MAKVVSLAYGKSLGIRQYPGAFLTAEPGDYVTLYLSGSVTSPVVIDVRAAGPQPSGSSVNKVGERWCELTRVPLTAGVPICSGFDGTVFHSMTVLPLAVGTYTFRSYVASPFEQIAESGGGQANALTDRKIDSTLAFYGQSKGSVNQARMGTQHYNARFGYSISSEFWNDILEAASFDLIEMNGNSRSDGVTIVSGVYQNMADTLSSFEDSVLDLFYEVEKSRALAEEKLNIGVGKRVL